MEEFVAENRTVRTVALQWVGRKSTALTITSFAAADMVVCAADSVTCAVITVM